MRYFLRMIICWISDHSEEMLREMNQRKPGSCFRIKKAIINLAKENHF